MLRSSPAPFALLAIVFSAVPAAAQQAEIRGVVRDEATAAALPYATVELVGASRRFTADDSGRYVIDELADGRWTLRASAPGYHDADAIVVVDAASPPVIEQDFALTSSAIELEGILVEAAAAPRPVAEEPVGAPPSVIDEARISAVPVAFEPDVLRVVQTLPAVAAASDYSSALYVRGATPDQTIVLLDGTPLFNPYHFAGLFSAIDVGLVENVVAHVGPTTAALGDRLAATIEIHSRAPPLVSTRGWGNIGLVSTNAGVSGVMGRGGYTVAARHTYIDLITRAAFELGLMDFAFPYGFTDVYGHVRHPLAGGEMRVSGYYNHEHVSPPGEELPDVELDFDWGTGAASAIWEGILGPALSMRAALGFSSFTGDFLGGNVGRPPAIDAHLVNRLVRPSVDFLWLAGGHDVRFGLATEFYRFGYDLASSEEDFGLVFPEEVVASSLATVAAHVETEWASSEDTRWRVGLRALAAQDGGAALLPQVGWSRDLDDEWSLFAAAGRKAQAVRSMRSEEAVTSSLFAYDVLAPAGERLAIGDEIGAGFEWRPRATTSVRVEAYARRAFDVPIAPVPANVYFTRLLVPHETVTAEDQAAGVEISAAHRFRDTELWLSYSGSWLRRTVGDESFTPRFHRAHHLQLLGTQSMWGRTALSASMQFGSGQPYSQAIAWTRPLRYDPESGGWHDDDGNGVLLEERNESRLPLYFRLDVSLRSSFTPNMFGRDVTIAPYLSVLNAIAYSNSAFTIYDIIFSGSGDEGSIGETHAPQMPLLPTIGMEWRF